MSFEIEKSDIAHNRNLWDEIEKINKQYITYNFDSVNEEPIKYEKRTTKEKFGHAINGQYLFGGSFDFKSFLSSKIYEDMSLYTGKIDKYNSLFIKFQEYKDKTLKIFETRRLYKGISTAPSDNRGWFSKNLGTSTKDRFIKLKEYEEKLFESKTFNPQFPYVILHLVAKTQYNYSIRNYERDYKYYFSDILACYEMALEKQGKMTFIQQQRSVLSDSKRYDIMKRDGFKCCICGATAADGVRLEVDHIKPVSKGGKSTDDNLQTLCERCNKGKRDKH